MGIFTYSDEEDTAGYAMEPKIKKNVMKKRYNELMKIQNSISLEKNTNLVGDTIEVLVDYSTMEKINQVINSFGTYQMIFEKAVSLPIINISGYNFVGFFDNNNNIITKVTIDVETELVAVYIKK